MIQTVAGEIFHMLLKLEVVWNGLMIDIAFCFCNLLSVIKGSDYLSLL
jgi:hypothetical protein